MLGIPCVLLWAAPWFEGFTGILPVLNAPDIAYEYEY